ncbi:DgyrCDS13817 [Dimorphilus gyrociliatus]|uniref:DgyrCDS13817 n=1 Tax=Dimorphilus gyrociliatus TaxID=2664684 RepID=A0A7I8WBX0_9ANNE|nr:DgyrCDS13817 [Dimorphilus gyrociliatus]
MNILQVQLKIIEDFYYATLFVIVERIIFLLSSTEDKMCKTLLILILLVLITISHFTFATENLNSTEIDEKIDRNLNLLERGVQHLFNGTTKFLVFIHRKIITDYYERLGLVPSNQSDGLTWSAIVDYLIGFVCLAGFCIFLTIIVPVISIIVCCCRMSGRCGRDNNPRERSRDKSKRICCTSFLFVLVSIAVISLVLAFTSNSILSTHLSPAKSGGLLSHSVSSVEKMATYRDGVIVDLLKLKDMAINTSSVVLEALENIPVASVEFYNEKTESENFLNQSLLLKTISNNLWKKIDIVEANCLSFLRISNHINQEFDRIRPDLREQLKNISKLELLDELQLRVDETLRKYSNNISSYIDKNDIRIEFDSALERAQEFLLEQQEVVRRSIYSTIETIINETKSGQAKIDSIDAIISRLQKLPLNRTIVALSTPPWTESFQNYEYLRLGTYIGICLLLLTVYAIFVIATILAWVRGPGEVGEKQSCDAEAASSCLVLAVGLGIVLFSTFMIVITAIFLFGGVAYTEVCRFTQPSLADIEGTPLGRVLDATVNARFLNGTSFSNTSIIEAIKYCKNNSGIYTAMQLESQFHLEQYLNVKNRVDMAAKIFDKIENATSPIIENYKTLPLELDNIIKDLGNGDFLQTNLQLNGYEEIKIKLDQDQIALKKIYGVLNPDGQVTDTLKKLHRRQFPQLINGLNDIYNNISSLKEDFLNVTKLSQELYKNLALKKAYIQKDYKMEIGSFTMNKMVAIYKYYKIYLDPMKNFIFKDMGKCKLLYTSLDQFVNFACTNTIHAFNAYWAAVGVVLLLLLPSFGAAASLVVLFRRTGKRGSLHDYKNLKNDTYRWGDIAKALGSEHKYYQENSTPPKVPLIQKDNLKTTIC